MIEIKDTYELLGFFIPFFASLIWVFLLIISLYDSETRQGQHIKRVSLFFLSTFSLACLFPMLAACFTPLSQLLGMLMPLVLAWIPIIGYQLVWCMTKTDSGDSFRCVKHYMLPLAYVLFLIAGEWFGQTSVWGDFIRKQQRYTYLIVVSLYAICYLSLMLIRIRTSWRALDAHTREGANAKRWYQFITKVALAIILSVIIILFPQNTTFLFVIYLALMVSFILITSYLCYCAVFLGIAQLKNVTATNEQPPALVLKPAKKTNRRIAKVSKNANGKMEMEPLTRKRFDEYMRKQKPYLDSNFRMTDLEEALSANRTVISNFVNRTYGVNFNQYINRLRIKEVERLQKLAQNKKYTLTELVRKAGFNTMRNYTRALVIESEKTENKEK